MIHWFRSLVVWLACFPSCAAPVSDDFQSKFDGKYIGKANLFTRVNANAVCNAQFDTFVSVEFGKVMWLQRTLQLKVGADGGFSGNRGTFQISGRIDGNTLMARAGSYEACVWDFMMRKATVQSVAG